MVVSVVAAEGGGGGKGGNCPTIILMEGQHPSNKVVEESKASCTRARSVNLPATRATSGANEASWSSEKAEDG